MDNFFEVPWQQPMVISSSIRPAVGPLLAVLASATMMLVDSGPKAGVGGSLKLLSLSGALLLFLPLCHRGVTRDFLEDELHAEGYLPPLTKQATEAFHVAVHHLPIDLRVFEAFLKTALTAALDGYVNDRFFACVFISWKLMLVFQKGFKSGLEVDLPKIARSQDEIGICV
jgi:hypothetical protein